MFIKLTYIRVNLMKEEGAQSVVSVLSTSPLC
jgi:hypothetical protein